MKTLCIILAALASGIVGLGATPTSVSGTAAGQNQIPAPTPHAITKPDANSRVWAWETYERSSNGQIIPHQHSYTELATGLNYWSHGQWFESKEEVDVLPNGTAEAIHGQHQAYFPGDIYQGEITLVTPNGQSLVSRPVALSYFDGTNTVVLAVLTNSIGVVVGNNQVVYPNAFNFNGFKADLRYTYTKAGFEQDIILRTAPLTPESYNLNPDTARLQVMTEFFNPPQPAITAQKLPAQAGVTLTDQSLDFGGMQMGSGRWQAPIY